VTDYPKPRSGGALTVWQDIDIVCLCENRMSSSNSPDLVTCDDCGQQFRVTCTIEVIGGFITMDESMIGMAVHYVNAADGKHLNARITDVYERTVDLEVEVSAGDGRRANVLNDEEMKAGNTWHFVELETA
jgi:transcription elongation factor Elf1